jgi:hypothetical protein
MIDVGLLNFPMTMYNILFIDKLRRFDHFSEITELSKFNVSHCFNRKGKLADNTNRGYTGLLITIIERLRYPDFRKRVRVALFFFMKFASLHLNLMINVSVLS